MGLQPVAPFEGFYMISTFDLVYIAGFCLVAGVASDKFSYIPVFLALVDPSSPVVASFIGMVVSVLLSGVFYATRSYRR